MIRHISTGILIILFVFALSLTASAAEVYKKYTLPSEGEDYFKIVAGEKTMTFTFFDGDAKLITVIRKTEVHRKDGNIYLGKDLILDPNSFRFGDHNFPLENIDRTMVDIDRDKGVTITFTRKSESQSQRPSRHKNVISVDKPIKVNKGDFLRGSVIGFWSDINIDGEINQDVFSLFGNITLGEDAVVRGDIVALNGTINGSGKATVYGEFAETDFEGKSWKKHWRKRWQYEDNFPLIAHFYYNRVDGAAPYLGIKYVDEDSLYPTVTAYGGYAFSSKRWRYFLGFEQYFFKARPITIGGDIYQRLASPDDWIISEAENTAFALIATEDYKDYYEARGGYGFVRWTPFVGNSYEIGVRGERQSWLDAHPSLWSLFGGSKRFPDNFYAFGEFPHALAKEQFDGKDLTALEFKASYETPDYDKDLIKSFWMAQGEIEWSPDSWSGDFDYTRYFGTGTRYQKLNEYSGLLVRLAAGSADGMLPMNKKFFMGGLGTLYGYRHKEYYGDQFWMADIEYHLILPHSDFDGWLFYNVAQIGDGIRDLGDFEVKHCLGVGLSLNSDIRLNVAQRLDKSGAAPRLYVRIGRLF